MDALFTGSNLDWYQAQAACYEKVVGDRGGWRLPTMEQLMSLVASSGGIGVPEGSPFNLTLDHGWTSTTVAGSPSDAWFFHFEAGFTGHEPQERFFDLERPGRVVRSRGSRSRRTVM